MYGFDFTPIFMMFVGIGAFLVGIVWFMVFLFTPNTFKVRKKLEPIRYELTVKNNKIDTLWVYKK